MSSVCLSVCDNVGELWSQRLEFFENNFTISLGRSLFATPTWRVCSEGNTLNFGPKSPTPCWFERRRHSIANSGRIWLKIAQRSQWRACRKVPSLFLTVPSLTPYDFPFPQNGGFICPQHTRMAISLQRVIRSTSCLVHVWRYLRFEQIQDGGRHDLWKISNGHISATPHDLLI